jgi:hypothetical protein
VKLTLNSLNFRYALIDKPIIICPEVAVVIGEIEFADFLTLGEGRPNDVVPNLVSFYTRYNQ